MEKVKFESTLDPGVTAKLNTPSQYRLAGGNPQVGPLNSVFSRNLAPACSRANRIPIQQWFSTWVIFSPRHFGSSQ